jgi:hypothetical protein
MNRGIAKSLIAILGLAGCSGGASVVPDGGETPSDEASPAGADLAAMDLAIGPGDAAQSAYPPGPYGNAVGDTIPPLVWEGYVDEAADVLATTEPFIPYSMNALRLSAQSGQSAPRLAIVHVAEFY